MEDLAAIVGIYAATLVAGAVSGLVPVINSELYLMTAVLLTDDAPTAVVLALLIAIGQMIGKAVLYQIARGTTKLGRGRFAARIARARDYVERWRARPYGVILLAAIVGIPPLYLVTAAAGILEIRFVHFLVIGVIGRMIRFVSIALVVVYV